MRRSQIGIEIEVVSKLTRRRFARKIRQVFPEFEIVCGGEWGHRTYTSNKIYIVDDTSIDYDYLWNDESAHEIVTPVMSVTDSKRFLKRFYDEFIATELCWLNETCGVHINVSLKSGEAHNRINPALFYLYLDAEKWLQWFGRCSYMYSKPNLHERNWDFDMTKPSVEILEHLNNTILNRPHGKFAAVNFEDFLMNKGRIEVRAAGGERANDANLMCVYIDEVVYAINMAERRPNGRSVKSRVGKKVMCYERS